MNNFVGTSCIAVAAVWLTLVLVTIAAGLTYAAVQTLIDTFS